MSKTCFQHGRRVGGRPKAPRLWLTPTPNPSPQGGGEPVAQGARSEYDNG